jgi:hypothetical protein
MSDVCQGVVNTSFGPDSAAVAAHEMNGVNVMKTSNTPNEDLTSRRPGLAA